MSPDCLWLGESMTVVLPGLKRNSLRARMPPEVLLPPCRVMFKRSFDHSPSITVVCHGSGDEPTHRSKSRSGESARARSLVRSTAYNFEGLHARRFANHFIF